MAWYVKCHSSWIRSIRLVRFHSALISWIVLTQVRAFRDQAESNIAAGIATPASLSLSGLRDDEASFVRALAAAWRLGHAPEDSLRGGNGLRVWVPPVRYTSTHDVSAGMSVAPEKADIGGEVEAIGRESSGGDGAVQEGEAGFDVGEMKCRVSYSVLPAGILTVDCDVDMPQHWPVIPRWVCCETSFV